MSQLSDTARLILEIYGDSNQKKNQGLKPNGLNTQQTALEHSPSGQI